MAIRNKEFNKSAKKFRRDLEQKINERLLRLSNELNKDLAEAFVYEARYNLIKNTSPQDANSANMINNLAQSITYEENKKRTLYNTTKNVKKQILTGYVVRVPIDKTGLTMFLEYGTGLEGKNCGFDKEANKIGWEYATNDNKKKDIRVRFAGHEKILKIDWYTTINGKKGFVFKKRSNSYIDSNDVIFQNEHKPYQIVTPTKPNRNGIIPKPYIRQIGSAETQSFGDYVISSGLKPARFIYNTKQDIIKAINYSKKIEQLKRKLNKIK